MFRLKSDAQVCSYSIQVLFSTRRHPLLQAGAHVELGASFVLRCSGSRLVLQCFMASSVGLNLACVEDQSQMTEATTRLDLFCNMDLCRGFCVICFQLP